MRNEISNRLTRNGARGIGLTIAVALVATLGCAATTIDNERLLAAAGFQMKLAQTPDQQARLKTMTQHELVPFEHDGQLRYVYADAKYCKCIYAGTEAAYQRYERLALKQRMANDQIQAAEMNEAAAMNWGMWGAWGPWY